MDNNSKHVECDNSQIYEERIVAFVDILGFKSMVDKSEESYQEQNRIMEAMDIIHGYKTMNDKFLDGGLLELGIQITTFSDSVIISYPITYDGGIFFIMLDLIHLQIDLLRLGMFIRGGISVGNAHHDEFNAFDPAIVKAYELESTMAIYPRIIISEDTLITGVKNSPSHQNEYDLNLLLTLLKKDNDGWLYLDYLKQYEELDYPETDYYKLLKTIRNILVDRLNVYNSKSLKIYSKYRWLLNYWNSTLCDDEFSVPIPMGLHEIARKKILKEYCDMRITLDYPHR